MADSSTSPSPTSTPAPSSALSTSFTPTGTRDSAPGTNNDDDNNNNNDNGVPGGMASYYFVFLILTLCIIAIVVFLNFRRGRKRRLQRLYGQQPAAPEDEMARRRRRYWEGRWMDPSSREEGLNENGEAPPAYQPKRPSQEAQRHEGGGEGVAVPMQTLSREDAGLKPPDYDRGTYQPAHGGASSSQR